MADCARKVIAGPMERIKGFTKRKTDDADGLEDAWSNY